MRRRLQLQIAIPFILLILLLAFAVTSYMKYDMRGLSGDASQNVVEFTWVAAIFACVAAIGAAYYAAKPLQKIAAASSRAAADDGKKMRQQVATLTKEQGRLSAVLANLADGVVITDRNGAVRLLNNAAAKLLGTPAEDALGRPFAQLAPHHSLIELWNACSAAGKEQVGMIEVSRHALFLQTIITPFIDANEPGYLIILQDLTRVRRLEGVRRDFISNVSHELRTPLAGMRALVDTLHGGAIKDKKASKRFLKRMDVEVDTMTQMVEELLNLTRIESGKAVLHIATIAVNDILLSIADRFQPQADRAGVILRCEPFDNLVSAEADPEQITIALTNLIHNAIKFTPPSGQIILNAQPDGEMVRVSIKDSGAGIPAEDMARVFERFYKIDRARSGSGTGLGLAIAKHIVQAHGGRIWVESEEGVGSTFYFTLPLA